MNKISWLAERAVKILREEGVKALAQKSLSYFKKIVKLPILPFALLKLKHLDKNCTLDKLLDFSFYGLWGLIRPLQVRNEISELLKILNKIKPETVLEIGTYNGGTLFLFSRTASENAIIISIDLPSGYPLWRKLLYKSFALPKQKIYLLRMDSHREETLKKVKAILSGRRLDFLFIDGDHAYEGVKRDFEMYSELVKEGGIIALHDIVPGPEESVGGVPLFWREIKGQYNSKEIVKDWNQGECGIGLIFLNRRRS